MDIIWFYGFTLFLGLLLGKFLYTNHKNKNSSRNAKIPVIGGMLAYELWLPHNNNDYDRIIEKVYVVIIAWFAFNVSWIFWFWLCFSILYRANFISER